MASSDELIIRYTLQDNFSARADHIRHKARQAASEVKRSRDQVNIAWGQSVAGKSTGMRFGGEEGGDGLFGDLFSNATSIFGMTNPISLAFNSVLKPLQMFVSGYLNIFKQLSTVTLAGVGAITAFVVKAVQAANEFDSAERSFSAMLGSFEKGRQMMLWIRQYGLTSGFNQGPIIETARTITALGLEADKWLPVLEKFALFAGSDQSNLTEMAAIFRRLAGGQIAEAFGPEGLGRFGINRKMLEQFGASFDTTGRFQGSIEDAMNVMMRMSTESPFIKNIKDVFDDSPAVKFSNAIDAIQIAMIDAGKVFQSAFMPFVEKFQNFVGGLVEGGVVTDFANRIVSMFTKLVDKAGGFEGILASITAGLLQLPNVIGAIGSIAIGMAKIIGHMIMWLIENVVPHINGVILAVRNIPGLKGLGTIALQDDGTLQRGLFQLETAMSDFEADRNKFSKGGGLWSDIVSTVLKPPTVEASEYGAEKVLESIDKNTRKTALNTEKNDYRRFALGGGDIGRHGIGLGELRGIAKHTPTIKIQATSDLERYVGEQVIEALRQLMQQGWIMQRSRV